MSEVKAFALGGAMNQIGCYGWFRVMTISLLLAGCAAKPIVHLDCPLTEGLAQYENVQVEVNASSELRQRTGYEATSAALLEEFIAHLKDSQRFSSVGTA